AGVPNVSPLAFLPHSSKSLKFGGRRPHAFAILAGLSLSTDLPASAAATTAAKPWSEHASGAPRRRAACRKDGNARAAVGLRDYPDIRFNHYRRSERRRD